MTVDPRAEDSDETAVQPLVSILVVNYASWGECVGALRSFAEHPPRDATGAPLPFEVIVIDNDSPSKDPEAEAAIRELIAGYPCGGELCMHDENGGYSKGMNLAYAKSRGEVIVVSNPDVIITEGTIGALVRALDDPTIGAAMPEIFWDEGHTARLPPNILPTLRDLVGLGLAAVSRPALHRYSRKRTRGAVAIWGARGDVDLPMLSGCFFAMQRSFIEQIGFFDERFPLYYEDTDLSQRVKKAGKRVVQVHASKAVHLYNRSGQTDFDMALSKYWISRRRYFRKWYGWFGQTVYDVIQWFLKTGWAKKRNARPPYPELVDLGEHNEKPVIEFGRHVDRVCVEFALDPYFYLAGGTFCSGTRWVPSDSMFKLFGPTTYFFRVVDVSGPEQELLGVYKYTQVAPQVFREMQPVGAGSS